MNNIIIYASNYGATKDYANKLALELDANIINIKDVNPKYLDAYDLIVIGSGLYASGLNESKKILKILKMYKDSNKKFIIFTVGIADPENINTLTFSKGKSSKDHTGWSYSLKWYDPENNLMEEIVVMSEQQIDHKGYFYSSMEADHEIDLAYFDRLLGEG